MPFLIRATRSGCEEILVMNAKARAPSTYIRNKVSPKGNCNAIPRFRFLYCRLRRVSTSGNVHAIVIFTALCSKVRRRTINFERTDYIPVSQMSFRKSFDSPFSGSRSRLPATRGSGACKYENVGYLFRTVRTKYEKVSSVSAFDIRISVTSNVSPRVERTII